MSRWHNGNELERAHRRSHAKQVSKTASGALLCLSSVAMKAKPAQDTIASQGLGVRVTLKSGPKGSLSGGSCGPCCEI